MPAEPIRVAVYITELLEGGSSHHVVSSAIYGIKWAHDMNGFTDPTNNAFVKNLHESAKRITGTKTVKKDAISSDLIIQLCDSFVGNEDLLVVRDLCMITTAFAGFLRYDELSSIKCSDIFISDEYFKICLTKSKTDQYRSGQEVVVAKGTTSACPYSMLLRYMALADLSSGIDVFLFKPAFRSKSVCKLIYKDKKLSYTTARERVVKMLSSVAPNLNLGLHSLRAGGVTAAAKGQVGDRCLKRHGRWKRDESKDSYIEDSLEKRLEVTQNLGL